MYTGIAVLSTVALLASSGYGAAISATQPPAVLGTGKTVYLPLTYQGNTDLAIRDYYTANVSIGTPPQDVSLIFDTGSSGVWAYGKKVYHKCRSKGRCADVGYYDPKLSHTSHKGHGKFKMTYGAGLSIHGNYRSDTLTLGEFAVQDVDLGVAKKVSNVKESRYFQDAAVLGAGFESNEVNYDDTRPLHKGFLRRLVEQGAIATRSYSLRLKRNDAPGGGVLFGGYDNAQFIGAMQVVPFLLDAGPMSGYLDSFFVTLSSVGVRDPQDQITKITIDAPVMLDSGTQYSCLPQLVMDSVAAATGATPDESAAGHDGGEGTPYNFPQYLVQCDRASKGGSVDYTFGDEDQDATVSVNYSRLIRPAVDLRTGRARLQADGSPQCALTLCVSDMPLLGADFMEAAYLVHHLDAKMLGIAQAAGVDDRPSDIVEIRLGDALWREFKVPE